MKPLLYSLLPRPPHPTRDGLAIRNYHLLAALASRFRVRAFALSDPEREYEGEWPAGVSVEIVRQLPRGARRLLAAISSVLAGGAYSEKLYRSFALSRRIEAVVAEERPAWIVAHSYHLGLGALRIGGPVWIDFHNIDSEIWRRMAETAGSKSVRWFARVQAPRVRRLERRLASAVSGLSCVSARDADALSDLGAAVPPLVVPNGVDLERYAFRREAPDSEIVVFLGDLSWPPNAEAVRWFAREIWPAIRRARPGALAEILGRSAPADLTGLASPGLSLLGDVADTRPHWERAAVAVVPLRAGGGTRLKILEAAATGVPVVSTSVGAEGLSFIDETEILRRNDAEPFARAIVTLLADPAAAQRQAAAARARVEAHYGWGPIGQAFAGALARAEDRDA